MNPARPNLSVLRCTEDRFAGPSRPVAKSGRCRKDTRLGGFLSYSMELERSHDAVRYTTILLHERMPRSEIAKELRWWRARARAESMAAEQLRFRPMLGAGA